ncbi:MAG TPA: hypothetical protein VN451_05965 [Chitinophagaceae bacterium]|nr:hypothetical protein [Chitinophagaceae bacterium]
MKRYHFVFLFLLFFQVVIGIACKSKKHKVVSENNIDAARNFIRAALDGKFDEARNYMLSDSLNNNYMDVAERNYARADAETKNGYRGASINMHMVSPVNDSITIVIYSNSFKNDHDTLKVVNENGQWLIDLKYLYEHDEETIPISKPVIDSSK